MAASVAWLGEMRHAASLASVSFPLVQWIHGSMPRHAIFMKAVTRLETI
jgi:hypothetical protein